MRRVRLCMLVLVLTAVGGEVWAGDIDRIIVFGDSLSDTGNTFLFSEGAFPPPSPYGGLQPDGAVFEPGRFSNGPVWVEYLAESLAVPVPVARGVDPAVPGGTNYAWGGAVTGLLPAVYLPSLTPGIPQTAGLPVGQQVTQYLGDVGDGAGEGDLFVVWAGANDIVLLDEPALGESVENLRQAITTLITVGAKQILVPNLPAIETAPAVSVGIPSLFLVDGISPERKIKKRIGKFNTKLRKALVKIERKYPDVTIYQLDAFSLFETVLDNPVVFGFNSNTAVPVLNEKALFLDGYLELLNSPFDSLFWDGVHFTTNAHQLVAEEALMTLGAAN